MAPTPPGHSLYRAPAPFLLSFFEDSEFSGLPLAHSTTFTPSPDLSSSAATASIFESIPVRTGYFPTRVDITSSLRSKIRALRYHAAWPFRRIAH